MKNAKAVASKKLEEANSVQRVKGDVDVCEGVRRSKSILPMNYQISLMQQVLKILLVVSLKDH